jgi:low density lipoprotein receptor-related protein 5/6
VTAYKVIESDLNGISQGRTPVVLPSFTFNGGSRNTGLIYGMDVNVIDNVLYYGDRNSSSIWEMPLDSTNLRERLTPNAKAWGITYDWINNYLYWTEDESNVIKRIRTNQSNATSELVLDNLNHPKGIAINPFSNCLYWTESGRIGKLLIDDSSWIPQTLVSLSPSSLPAGIAISYLHNRLFWGDQSNGSIHTVGFEGENPRTIVSPTNQRIFQVAIIGNDIYWTNERSNKYGKSSIFNTSVTYLDILRLSSNVDLYGITTLDDNKQPGNGFLVCLHNSMGCSHYCNVDSYGDAVCTCPAGYTLLADQVTCAGENNIIIAAVHIT